jgi:hypothetical protein
MRLHHHMHQPEAAHHAYQRLTRHLAELDLDPSPATRALLDPPGDRDRSVTSIGR